MKRCLFLCLVLAILLCLCSCSKTLHGTAALVEKAREELPIADAESIELRYAGQCVKDETALVWFISGNEYQSHYYLPMECEIIGEDAYKFARTYKPIDRGGDIAVLQWQGGYAFCINNPECALVRITDGTGTREERVEKNACPYIFYNSLIPAEYLFLDSQGNEIS